MCARNSWPWLLISNCQNGMALFRSLEALVSRSFHPLQGGHGASQEGGVRLHRDALPPGPQGIRDHRRCDGLPPVSGLRPGREQDARPERAPPLATIWPIKPMHSFFICANVFIFRGEKRARVIIGVPLSAHANLRRI